MIFLRENTMLERDLVSDDIKPRLLGHWGTCPGLILVYSHFNRLIVKNNIDCLFVVGPGHGCPALLATLWIEGSMERFYPQYSRTKEGLQNLIAGFSTPGGLPRFVHILSVSIRLFITN